MSTHGRRSAPPLTTHDRLQHVARGCHLGSSRVTQFYAFIGIESQDASRSVRVLTINGALARVNSATSCDPVAQTRTFFVDARV